MAMTSTLRSPPRRRAPWVAGGVLAALALGIAAGEAAGWPFLRQPLERAIARAAEAPVQLQGRVRLHLVWRPRLEVEHLQIGSGARFEVPHLLQADRALLAWRWGDVWRWRGGGPLRVETLQADRLDAHLVRLADGAANWPAGQPREPRPPDGGMDLPDFGTLTVGQGRIRWRDAVQDVDLDIALHGGEGQALAGQDTGYEATFKGRYQAIAMNLKVNAGGTLPLLRAPDANAPAPWVPVRVEGSVADARLLYDGQAAALLGSPRLQGTLRFSGPSLAAVGKPLGIALPATPPFDLRGQLQHDGTGAWRLQAERATIGTSRLAGELLYDSRTRPSRLTGEVRGPRLAFADLGPAVGAGGAGPSTEAGRVLPRRRFDLPSLRAMDADVQMNVDELDFGTPALAPLRQLRTRVRLDGGVLRLEALRTVVAGGSLEGTTQLDAREAPAKWEAKLDFAGIDMAGWLRALRPGAASGQAPAATTAPQALKREREQARRGGDQAVQAYLTGALFGSVQVRGTGNTAADILGSLDGPIRLSLREGTLSYLVTEAVGLDVAQALGVLLRGDRPLPLHCARLDLVARSGVIEPRLAVVDNRDSTVWITGPVNLRDETLDLRVVARPKDWSPLSLRTPITVTGTLGRPDVGVESGPLVGKVIGAVALGAAAGPLAALLPLIEAGSREGADPCDPPASAMAPPQPPAPPPARTEPGK